MSTEPTPDKATGTIALFGLTGGTGRHFAKLALEEGYKVKALVRSPEKVELKNDNLEIIQGSFTEEEDIKKTIADSDYVVSMAGAKLGDPKKYPKDIMLNFVKMLVPAMESENTKVFLYQAGAFSHDMNGKIPLTLKFLRASAGRVMGILPNVKDNDNVVTFLASPEVKTPVIITQPGALTEKDSVKELHLSTKPPSGSVTFFDLAKCTLKALTDEAAQGKCHYVV